jgi:hypothetical protein
VVSIPFVRERFGNDVLIKHQSIIPRMLKAGLQWSRQRGTGFLALHVSLLPLSFWLLFIGASGVGQAALAQQKPAAAPAAAEGLQRGRHRHRLADD